MENMEECIGVIHNWMTNKFLQLNDDKSEVLFLHSPYMLNSFSKPPIHIGEQGITDNDTACNISVNFDTTVKMDNQSNQFCKGAWCHLRNTGKRRSYFNASATKK